MDVLVHQLADGGEIPNSRLPLLLYRGALPPDAGPAAFEQLFESHGWAGTWRNGVYPFHHYHSTAHEVLGVYAGSAEILLGGEGGLRAAVEAGDAVLIPAGVGHKRLAASPGFAVVGAYPRGQDQDLCRGRAGERPAADDRIDQVPLPSSDPVCGRGGPLDQHWRSTSPAPPLT